MPRTGITPVVAVVLLLMMTVVAAGGAYTFITTTTQQAQGEASDSLRTSLDVKDVTCTRYGNAAVAVSNDGQAQVDAATADIYVYGPDGELVGASTGIDIGDADWRQPGGFGEIAGTVADGFSHSFHTNRENPHTVALYAPYDGTNVSYYIDATADSGDANTTVEVPAGNVTTMTLNWEGDHRFYSSEPLIVAKRSDGDADSIYVPPTHTGILHTFSENRIASTSGTTIDSDDPYYNATDPLSSTQIADANGYDADMGIPTSMVTDRYVVPHEVDDYAVAAVEPTTVTVQEWSGSGFTTNATHDFSAASRDSPMQAEVDDQSGDGGTLNYTAPVLVEGTGDFYLRTNDQQADEYPVIGYGSGDYQEAIALFAGTVDYATVEDDTDILVNGSTVVSEPTPAAGSFSVGRGDMITFTGPVGMEMTAGHPVAPVMTAGRTLQDGVRYRVELVAGDVSTAGGCRPEPAE